MWPPGWQREGDLKSQIIHVLENKIAIADKMVEFTGKDVKFVEIIARGTSMSSAMQAALNIKEMDKIAAEAISGGQFRHGPIEMVNKDFRCIVLSSDDETRALSEDMAWNIAHKWGGGKVIFITNRACERLDADPRVMQCVHDVAVPLLAPVMEILLIQLFMIKLAVKNNIEPGVFRYSSKWNHNPFKFHGSGLLTALRQ